MTQEAKRSARPAAGARRLPVRRGGRWVAVLLALVVLATSVAGCRSWRGRPKPPYRKVSPAVAFEILRDTPDIAVLDLRPAEEFTSDTGHLRNARNVPLSRLPFRLIEIGAFRDETLLVYCGTQQCAEEGMAVLVSSGFDNAILIDGGIDAWIEQGFKTQLPQEAVGRGSQPSAGREEEKGKEKIEGQTEGLPADAPPPPPPLPGRPI